MSEFTALVEVAKEFAQLQPHQNGIFLLNLEALAFDSSRYTGHARGLVLRRRQIFKNCNKNKLIIAILKQNLPILKKLHFQFLVTL